MDKFELRITMMSVHMRAAALMTVCLAIFVVGCNKGGGNYDQQSKAQSIWNALPLGNQIAFFDKKYDLTPMEIGDWNGSQQRVYEIDEKSKCYLTLGVSKSTGKIFQITANSQCNIQDDGHGISIKYDSKTKFRDLTKDINKQNPPLFEADCLNCGNAYEPEYHMTFVGPHANGFIDVIYSFAYNDGISKWIDEVIKGSGGYGDPKVDENKVNYSKFSSQAINLWSNEKPNSISLRASGLM